MHRIEAYIRLAIIFIMIITILYFPVLMILKKRGKNIIRQFGNLGLCCSIFLIIFATILFVPITFHPEQYVINLVPFNWEDDTNQIIVEVIPNIMMFVPLGFFIPVIFKNKRKLYKTTIMVFLLTFSIEFFQYFIGRLADINDIITNLLGGIIGYCIFKICNVIFKRTKWWNKLIDCKGK